MSLEGDLPDFNVVDVLHLFGLAAKTGVVRFSRRQEAGTQRGALFFRDGVAVAAETNGLVGEAALEMLCSWNSGDFVFREGATSPRENLELPAGLLLERAGAALEEWRAIREVLPSPSAPVWVVREPAGSEDVCLSGDEWGLVAQMCRLESVSAWAQQAGSGLHAYRILRRLLERGLIRVE